MNSLISHPKGNHMPTHPSHSSASSACAACKYQRRRCTPDCTLAPHFPANNPRQFLNVHRLFGVSNILKILKTVEPHLHREAMSSIIFQSNARARDPVGGCYRIILDLQHQHELLASELQHVLNQIALYRAQIESAVNMTNSDEATYAPPGAVVDAYENMTIMQQQQAQQQQQQYCNYFFGDAQDEQESYQNINDNENTINMLANEAEFDMSINLLGNDMLEMDMIGSRLDFGQEEDVKPLVDVFDMRKTFEDDEDSMDVTAASSITAVHCSSNTEQKDDQSPIEQQLQEHELKCAASYFTLQNCNNSVV